MKNKLLSLLILIVASSVTFSQTIVLDSTFESRCSSSGAAYFTDTDGTPGAFWSLTTFPAGYVPGSAQTDPFFTSLPAGNYVVTLTGGAGATLPFTVAGTYVDPVIVVDTIIDATCPGQGVIEVSLTLGNDPYRYRLLHRDSAAGNFQPWQSTGVFDSLRSGNYSVQAEDSCGVLKTVSGLFVDYPFGGPMGYNYNGNTQVYITDEATSFPTSCTETTVAMMLRRNYVYLSQNTGTMWDGNGTGVADHTDPNQVPLSLLGGLPPYTYSMTESEAYSFLPPLTDALNDLRPDAPYSSSSATSSTTYYKLGRGIAFDVANDLTIYSMSMIGVRTGYNVLIVLYDNAGNELYRKWEEQDATNGNDNVASLGWFVPAGTGYRMTVEAINSPGLLSSEFFATGVNYPISAGDITITGNADPTTDARILNFFDAVVYTKNTTAIATNATPIFSNVPRTNANTYTIVGEDACGEKVFRSVTTKIPLEFVGVRRTAAECGIGQDRLFQDQTPYALLHQDVAQHYYTYTRRGNSIGGTLPYTYTVTSDIGYSPAPITTDLATINSTNAGVYYDPQRLRNLDGSQWQPTPGSEVTVNITDACGESVTEVFGPPTGSIPVEEVIATNDLEGCAPWRRYRIYHNPYVDTFENFILNINPLTPGGAHARVLTSVNYFTPEYNYYQGASMKGNTSLYPYFLPGDYEITFTGSCSGNVVKDTITVTPSNFSFTATPIQPCSATPTGEVSVSHVGGEQFTSPVDLLFAGPYDPSIDYAVATPLDQSLIVSNTARFTGLAPGIYTILHGSTNSAYAFLMNCAEYQTVTILSYKDPVLSLTYDPSCATPTGNIYATVVNGIPPYTYQWKLSTDPISVYGTNSQSSDTIMGLPAATYDVRIIDSCGQSTVRTVNTAAPFAVPPPVSNAATICEGSQFRVSGINFTTASYDWLLNGVSIGAPDSNVLVIDNVAASDAGNYTFQITLTGCATPPSPITALAVVASTNTAIAVASPDRLCEGAGPINLTGGNTTPPTITTGTWSQVSGPTSPLVSTITQTGENAVVTDISNTDGPPEDPYVFMWEIDNGTCVSNAYDTVYIHRNPPSAYSGFDQNLCEQTATTLNATSIPFGFGYWTQVSGNPVTIADTTDPATTISGLIWPDTVVMRWTVVNDSANATCVASHENMIINKVQPIASTANAGADDTLCGGTSYTLQARPIPSDSGIGKWVTISYPGVAPTISGAGLLPNSVATLTLGGEYIFAWEVSNGVCTVVADTVSIFLINANAGQDIVVCMDNLAGLRMNADSVPGIPGTWSTPSALTFTPNSALGVDTALVTGITVGSHTVTYTVTSGSCTQTDDVVILASNPPSISMAGADQLSLCQDTAILGANVPVDGSGIWTQISGPSSAIMRDFDSAYNIVEGLIVGSYEFVWTITNQPCSPELDTVLIQVSQLPPTAAIISVTNPTCILSGSITVEGSPAGSYEYSIDSATGGYQASPIFNGLDTLTYRAWVRDLTNPACISRSSVPVTLLDTLPGPTFDTAYFTPVSTCNGSTTRGTITAMATGGNGSITYNLTGDFTASNTTGIFTNLAVGTYTIKATDSLGCPIDLISDFNMPEIKCDTFYAGIPSTGGTDSTCLLGTGTGGPYDIGSCDGTDGTYNGFLLSFNDSCVTYTPPVLPFTGDTACIIICDTINHDSTMSVIICDTNVIIYYPTPVPDTTVTVLPPSGSVVVCADTTELLGNNLTYTLCSGASAGVFNQNSPTSNCYTYIPLIKQIDTTCVIVCDEYGVCDTSVFVFIPALTTDTVITTDTVVCVDTTEMPAGHHTITGCDGMSPTTTSGGGTVTIDPLTGCVTTSPDFGTNITDTTCIIVCDTMSGICDTTIIITVKPPTPDTIVQFTNGNPTDTCITTEELLGTNLTYLSCEAASNGVLANTDTCYNYIPIVNAMDTACIIICDEYGICDTTVLIYVPPVIPDTVITMDTVVCVDTTEMPNGHHTITGCDGMSPTTTSGGGTATIDPITGCVTTSPDFGTGITDTTCIIVCDTVIVICDTTIIVTVKAPTPDTIVQMTNGGPVDSCLTQNELPGTMFTYTNCGNPINGTLTNSNDTCFNYTPINDVLDTACIIICDENGICDTTIFIYVPPVTPDTVITTDTIVCVDTNDLLGASVDSITTCDGSGMSTGGGTVTIDPLTGCVTTSPDFGTGITDTTCIVVCKNVAGVVICDTTIIVTVKAPTPDTIIQLTNGGPVDSCLTQNELLGTMFTYTNCGNPINGTLTNSNDTCFNYTPINDVLDTACVIICDENGICDTTIFIYVPPVTPDTIYTLDTLVCVDTTEMPNGHHTVTGCDGMSPTTTSGGGTVTLDAQGCATISPIFTGKTDTTCIIICDTVFGICDTTLIINMRRAVPDTIIECIPRDGQANDSNMNTNDLLGDVATISVFKLASHGQFTLTNDTNSSYQTSPSPRLDTVQVSFCDAYGFCDTFTFIYIPPMTVDTIYSQGGLVCVDTTEMPRMAHTTVGTCDGTNLTSNGGTVVPMSNGCVTITPDFSVSKVDTTCIVLCDTILPMCECDTTYIISFEGAGIDTITIQLPRGTNTADTCLSTRELFGSTYTYRRLGGPTPHGPVTTHNDTCINYVQTSTTKYLDTARVLICDEYGNCDTTIIIYVPTPDPDTMYVGPVIPVTNVDTCVVLESSYMTGHHVGTCDSTGTSSAGVPVTITGLCVRYPVPSPVFTGDTVCIIVCDTIRDITICDTTLIVYLPDTTPPTVICKNDTVYLDNLGTVTIDTSNVLSSVTDNTLVNAVWLTPSTFNCANVGPNNVSVYARDTNRNMDSCQSIVTVLDTIPPTVICRNITIQLDSNGNASIVAMDIDGGSTDNCAIASMVINQTSFDCSHVGSNSVTLTVTDIYGNSSSCTSTVTVEDNIAPIAYCPGDKQRVIRNTNCSYIVEDFTSETSTWDNCSAGSGVTITQLPLAGTEVFLENASQLITITATDGSGNTSSCSFNVYARCVKELNIPQFISPDGSGQNDTWEIPELANYPNNTVKVFNRWGNLVMEEKGYSTGWNGSSNVDRGANRLLDNKMLPEGTYFYIIDLGTNDIEPYVGYLQIKR